MWTRDEIMNFAESLQIAPGHVTNAEAWAAQRGRAPHYPVTWRYAFDEIMTPAIMDRLVVPSSARTFWYALARQIAKIVADRHPGDTRALLLRDARESWIARGVEKGSWMLFATAAVALYTVDTIESKPYNVGPAQVANGATKGQPCQNGI